jgi:hypothetical protein
MRSGERRGEKLMQGPSLVDLGNRCREGGCIAVMGTSLRLHTMAEHGIMSIDPSHFLHRESTIYKQDTQNQSSNGPMANQHSSQQSEHQKTPSRRRRGREHRLSSWPQEMPPAHRCSDPQLSREFLCLHTPSLHLE